MDSRERLDVLWGVIKLAPSSPEHEAMLRDMVKVASEAAPVGVLVKIMTTVAETQEEYLKHRN